MKYRRGGLNHRNIFSQCPKARSSRPQCQQVWFPLRLPLWFAGGHLLAVASQGLSSMCTPLESLHVQISSSYKDTDQTGLGPTLASSW